MRRLAGAQLLELSTTHRAPVHAIHVPVTRMHARAQCLQGALQFFATLYSFCPF
jgi:hypothetical protein